MHGEKLTVSELVRKFKELKILLPGTLATDPYSKPDDTIFHYQMQIRVTSLVFMIFIDNVIQFWITADQYLSYRVLRLQAYTVASHTDLISTARFS
jgi:hypothetical protein